MFRYEVRAYVVCEHGFGLRIWVRASDSALGFVFKVWCMIGVRIRVRVWGSKIIIIVFYYNPLGNERPPSIRTKTPRVHTQFTATLVHAAKSRNSFKRLRAFMLIPKLEPRAQSKTLSHFTIHDHDRNIQYSNHWVVKLYEHVMVATVAKPNIWDKEMFVSSQHNLNYTPFSCTFFYFITLSHPISRHLILSTM